MKKKTIVLVIAAVIVVVIGAVAVFADSQNSSKVNQTVAETSYCTDTAYSFCDEFAGAGMDTAKWKELQNVEPVNNWIQAGDGIMKGNPRAVSVPEYGDMTYEARLKLGFRSDFVFRFKDLNNFYSFKLRAAGTDGAYYGRIIPSIVANGTETAFDAIWDKQVSIVTGQDMAFKMVASGNKFSFYIDGKLLGTWTDPNSTFSSGSFGFKAGSEQGTDYDFIHVSTSNANGGGNDGDKNTWDRLLELLSGGAGKSGKTPQGLESAPGVQKKIGN